MKCVICKRGETRQGKTTVTLERDGTTLVVKGVPASVCANCGEEHYPQDHIRIKALPSGEIWYQGERIDKEPPQNIVARGIAHVPKGRRLFYAMSVLDNLEMGAYLRRDKREVKRNLEKVFAHFPRLKERQNQAAGTLSGGEQQMLACARALMSNPKVMLMDEPSIGLSPIMVDEVVKIITDINQSGVSIILVEQNAYMALGLAHKGYVLQTGTLVLAGDTKELLDNEEVKRAYLGGEGELGLFVPGWDRWRGSSLTGTSFVPRSFLALQATARTLGFRRVRAHP